MNRTTRVLVLLLLAAAGLPLARPALAQATRPDQARGESEAKPGEAAPPPEGFLAGPRVDPEAREGANAAGRGNALTRAADRLPTRLWLRIFQAQPLDEAQRDATRRILREFERAQRTFRREKGSELDAMRRELAAARRAETPVSPSLRDRFAALQASMPRVEAYQERLWALLDEDQRAAMQVAIAEETEAMRRRREADGGGGMAGPTDRMTDRTSEPAGRLDSAAQRRLDFLRKRQVDGDARDPDRVAAPRRGAAGEEPDAPPAKRRRDG